MTTASTGSEVPARGQQIPLNELPTWSPWPARIMGLEPWTVPTRNLDKIATEYNDDKYAKLLAWVKTRSNLTLAQAEAGIVGMVGLSPEKQICLTRRGELFVTTAGDAFAEQFALLRRTVSAAAAGCRSVVELGCGAGLNLWHLKQALPEMHFAGGDFSQNAVAIANSFGQKVVEFNFYDENTYRFIADCPAPVAVFTSHALEQLPTAAPFVKSLSAHRKQIKAVVHLEPLHELHGGDLLGLLRRRYTTINDYSRDLLSALRSAPGVTIDRQEYDVLGINPLNPTSIVQWHFE